MTADILATGRRAGAPRPRNGARVGAARAEERVVTVFGAIGIWIGIELAAVGLVVGLLV